MGRRKRYEKRGRPVSHPKVKCVENGHIFDTYTEAAESIGGSRKGVSFCTQGLQRHHHGYHFIFVQDH